MQSTINNEKSASLLSFGIAHIWRLPVLAQHLEPLALKVKVFHPRFQAGIVVLHAGSVEGVIRDSCINIRSGRVNPHAVHPQSKVSSTVGSHLSPQRRALLTLFPVLV